MRSVWRQTSVAPSGLLTKRCDNATLRRLAQFRPLSYRLDTMMHDHPRRPPCLTGIILIAVALAARALTHGPGFPPTLLRRISRRNSPPCCNACRARPSHRGWTGQSCPCCRMGAARRSLEPLPARRPIHRWHHDRGYECRHAGAVHVSCDRHGLPLRDRHAAGQWWPVDTARRTPGIRRQTPGHRRRWLRAQGGPGGHVSARRICHPSSAHPARRFGTRRGKHDSFLWSAPVDRAVHTRSARSRRASVQGAG